MSIMLAPEIIFGTSPSSPVSNEYFQHIAGGGHAYNILTYKNFKVYRLVL